MNEWTYPYETIHYGRRQALQALWLTYQARVNARDREALR